MTAFRMNRPASHKTLPRTTKSNHYRATEPDPDNTLPEKLLNDFLTQMMVVAPRQMMVEAVLVVVVLVLVLVLVEVLIRK